MNLLQLHHLSLSLGAHPIFTDLNWDVQQGQKVGLIGPNGAGKTSLFKVINGAYDPEPGSQITRSKELSIGYLAQHPELEAGQTAFEAALTGSPRWAAVYAELEKIEISLADPEVYGSEKKLANALERQQVLVEEYMILGGDQYPQRVKQLLFGLGLEEGQLNKPVGQLSGGQKKLVGLARLLMAQPQLLLLDEPDNHLDLKGKAFLEKWIQAYDGAVVIVSHDRYLLDAVVTDIAELEDGKLTVFRGDYSEFMIDKQLRLARQQGIVPGPTKAGSAD